MLTLRANFLSDESGEFDIQAMTIITIIIYTGVALVFGADVYAQTLDRIDAFSDNGTSLLDILTDWVPDTGLLLLNVVIDSIELLLFIFTIDIWPLLKIALGLILGVGWTLTAIAKIKDTFS